jgi:hypothetical protein
MIRDSKIIGHLWVRQKHDAEQAGVNRGQVKIELVGLDVLFGAAALTGQTPFPQRPVINENDHIVCLSSSLGLELQRPPPALACLQEQALACRACRSHTTVSSCRECALR